MTENAEGSGSLRYTETPDLQGKSTISFAFSSIAASSVSCFACKGSEVRVLSSPPDATPRPARVCGFFHARLYEAIRRIYDTCRTIPIEVGKNAIGGLSDPARRVVEEVALALEHHSCVRVTSEPAIASRSSPPSIIMGSKMVDRFVYVDPPGLGTDETLRGCSDRTIACEKNQHAEAFRQTASLRRLRRNRRSGSLRVSSIARRYASRDASRRPRRRRSSARAAYKGP